MGEHRPKTILLAEDERIVRKTLEIKLAKEGFKLLIAEDGKQAMDLLKIHSPDLVITDLMMPYHNGLEILEHIKKNINSETPVLILSAAGQENTVLEAFRIGADDFITKPFSPNELVIRVKKLIQK